MKAKIKFFIIMVVLFISITSVQIIKMIVRPKVAFIEDNNNKSYRKQMNKKINNKSYGKFRWSEGS